MRKSVLFFVLVILCCLSCRNTYYKVTSGKAVPVKDKLNKAVVIYDRYSHFDDFDIGSPTISQFFKRGYSQRLTVVNEKTLSAILELIDTTDAKVSELEIWDYEYDYETDTFVVGLQILSDSLKRKYGEVTFADVSRDTLGPAFRRLLALAEEVPLLEKTYYWDYDYKPNISVWIGVLLYFENCIDTLSLPSGPLDSPGRYRYQYNNMLKDSTDTRLFDLISNYIRDHDPVWKERNEDHYYEDGRYHDTSKNWYTGW